MYKAKVVIAVKYFDKSTSKTKSFTVDGEYDFAVDIGSSINDTQRFEAISQKLVIWQLLIFFQELLLVLLNKNEFKNKIIKWFLDHKTMYYDKIDFSFVNRAFSILEKEIKIPFVIHIVGTNGKGSTGRFLSHYLYKTGFKTLHYSSLISKKFNERIWINGADVSDNLLQNAHEFFD